MSSCSMSREASHCAYRLQMYFITLEHLKSASVCQITSAQYRCVQVCERVCTSSRSCRGARWRTRGAWWTWRLDTAAAGWSSDSDSVSSASLSSTLRDRNMSREERDKIIMNNSCTNRTFNFKFKHKALNLKPSWLPPIIIIIIINKLDSLVFLGEALLH